jgi:hypothetical protein
VQLWQRFDAVCGVGVDDEDHPIIGVTWTGETRAALWPPSLEPTSTTMHHAACLGSSTRRLGAPPTDRSSTQRPSVGASKLVGSPVKT